ncbi:MAG: hypothetical protein K8H86_11380 [Ignavibacteriaceae bacterium]|nr:hypothetical protein [Ignavibacteriaceae bacterium]
MKKVFLILIAFTCILSAQTEYVEVENPIYNFLERMETLQLIEGYNSFILPKTRRDVAIYLKQVILNINKLNDVDREIVEDFKTEFEYELFGSLEHSSSLLGSNDNYLSNNTQRYFYLNNLKDKGNIFINLLLQEKFLINNNRNINNTYKATATIFGGEIRGTILNKFGFHLKGTNGALFGDKEAGYILNQLKYNFKFNEKPEEKFFDEAEGYITADFDIIKFKMGRDKMLVGYGAMKPLLSGNTPMFDYISMEINYGVFNFSYFHGKLIGKYNYKSDAVTGGEAFVEEKYIGYHRFGFNINKHADIGFGEFVIYGGRPLDLSYLNPFNFYKSTEHSNRDRDNSMLFFDFNNNSIKSVKLSALFLIDDISFSKLGSGWWGNQTISNLRILIAQPINCLPLDIRLEYIKIDPYVFSHRLYKNNFTHFGTGLSEPLQPNSSVVSAGLEYRFSSALFLTMNGTYSVHGANPVMKDGTIVNVGGDILLGHRVFDLENVNFLDGDREYFRKVITTLTYEPMNDFFCLITIEYIRHNLQNSKTIEELNSFISLMVKL